ncbi:hypothetical protein J6590_079167 [Homalodisca vitripennis]|nr:hypothetical protein J6590_079167 [Homalodisca vitripennis]
MSEVVVGEVRSRLPRIAGRYRSPSHLAARSEVEKKNSPRISIDTIQNVRKRMFFFRRHQRGAAPKVLPKPALMAGGTRILGGGIGKTRKYNKAMHQLNGRRDSAITLSTRRSTLTSV